MEFFPSLSLVSKNRGVKVTLPTYSPPLPLLSTHVPSNITPPRTPFSPHVLTYFGHSGHLSQPKDRRRKRNVRDARSVFLANGLVIVGRRREGGEGEIALSAGS